MRRLENPTWFTARKRKIQSGRRRHPPCSTRRNSRAGWHTSIEKSERLSAILQRKGVRHVVLNAKFHEREAEIVAQAGRLGMVTISTNMAGRGTIFFWRQSEFMAARKW